MSLRIYNTQTARKDPFLPLQPGKVGMYVCGVTVYDGCHIGHARSAVVFDVIFRYLRHRGYDVTYVKNFTDVDDKIIRRSQSEGVSIEVIAERFIQAHNEEMGDLGVLQPTMTPRATQHISDMIHLIEILGQKELAYEVKGDVYFAVNRFPAYGRLSHRTLEDLQVGARVEVNDLKRNPLDFVLWKASKDGEPWWPSPWGPGRPGWHIECSAMSQRYLGETFDIHGGGEDLVFPHHENEVAQSEGATGKPFANYWIHNGFVRINREKMSKSLGNFLTIRDVLRQWHPEALRFFILQNHYRSPIDFSDNTLAEARAGLNRLYHSLGELKAQSVTSKGHDDAVTTGRSSAAGVKDILQSFRERFIEAMDDDFNTARALGHLFELCRFLNGFFGDRKTVPQRGYVTREAEILFAEWGSVLGILQEDPAAYFQKDRDREVRKRNLEVGTIEALIRDRQAARASRNWAKADDIRRELAGMGVDLRDLSSGTAWGIA